MQPIITPEELEGAKKYLENLEIEQTKPISIPFLRNTRRKIFKGETPILLMGSRFLSTGEKTNISRLTFGNLKIAEKFANTKYDEYLGAILYLLHQKLGCSFIYSFEQFGPFEERWTVQNDHADIKFMFNDQELLDLIREKQIQLITKISISDDFSIEKNSAQRLRIIDFNSSYNYYDFTNFSVSLARIATSYDFETSSSIYSEPPVGIFPAYGFKLSEETANTFFKNTKTTPLPNLLPQRGILLPEETMPPTIKAIFTTNDIPDLSQMIMVFQILYEHILDIQEKIQKEGLEHALTRKKKKN